MISKKMAQALNEQINNEFYSAYLYLSMSAYFEEMSLKGLAKWMHLQAKEEINHGMKIFDFIIERDGKVILEKIDMPASTWKSPLAVFKAALEHEKKVTGMIYNLVDLAIKEKDYTTKSFLQWYLDEQVEEEAQVKEVIDKFTVIDECACGVLMIDKELGKRE